MRRESALDCAHQAGALGVEKVHRANLSSKPRATGDIGGGGGGGGGVSKLNMS